MAPRYPPAAHQRLEKPSYTYAHLPNNRLHNRVTCTKTSGNSIWLRQIVHDVPTLGHIQNICRLKGFAALNSKKQRYSVEIQQKVQALVLRNRQISEAEKMRETRGSKPDIFVEELPDGTRTFFILH